MPDPAEPDREPKQGELLSFMRFSHVGLQFALTVGLLTMAGVWADGKWGTSPLFTLIGTSVGFGAGFFNLYRAVYPTRRS